MGNSVNGFIVGNRIKLLSSDIGLNNETAEVQDFDAKALDLRCFYCAGLTSVIIANTGKSAPKQAFNYPE